MSQRLRRVLAAARGRRIGAALALLATIGVVVAIVLITQSSTSPGSASASSQGNSGSTAVERRNLVATDTESGTLSYNNPQTVYNRLSGTITWLPSVGQVIHQGEALFKVNGLPVTLMNGSTPAYRDLNASDSAGPDILQLNRALIALGYTSEGIVADDEWQPATTAAVEVFQESVGESPTGSLSLGQVVFLPGNQLVSTVEATLGSDGGGSGGTSAAYHPSGPTSEFVSLTKTTQTTTTPGSPPSHNKKHHHGASSATTPTTLAALIALLKAEAAQLKAESAQLRAAEAASRGGKSGSPSGSSGKSSGGSGGKTGGGSSGGGATGGGSSGGGGGGGGGGATAVLQTSSTQLVATVDLDASKQSEAQIGEKVTVEMPAGNTVNGRISAVSPVAQSSSNSGNGNGNGSGGGGSSGGSNGNGSGSSGATVPVTITLSGHQSGAGLDQAAVSVNFVQSQAKNVLSVPVTALLATSGGGYAVQEAAPPHNLIPVSTGLFAAGYVQISGQGIYPGLQVTDSQG